jgi:hypothetical protein
MLLKMLLRGEEVDSVPVEHHRLQQEGYLEALLQCLRLKHKKRLGAMEEIPVFFIEAPSKMNNAGFNEEE